MFTKSIISLGLAALASAHVVIVDPVPYGQSSLNNGPLLADGSDFPCKQRPGVYNLEGASNTYALGSSGNNLQFKGSAVHGGGSCQVVLTYDAQPDKNSVWKVITSIEGGCPAQEQTGNMGDNANFPVPYKYSFSIPANIPAGQGTIAWTWFNKIGNREMYMNCGPVTLTGAGGPQSNYDALPDMFVANIGSAGNGCGTKEGKDVAFPNPGSAVVQLNGATNVFDTPACTPAPGKGNGGGRPANPAPTTAAGGDSPAKPSATPSIPGGVFIPVNPSPSAPAAPSSSKAPAPTAAPAPAPSPSPSPAPGNGDGAPTPKPPTGGAGAQSPGTACADEGAWNCVGGNSFQRCASGAWSAILQLAAGTSCTPGQSSNINMVVTRNGRKRAFRYRSL